MIMCVSVFCNVLATILSAEVHAMPSHSQENIDQTETANYTSDIRNGEFLLDTTYVFCQSPGVQSDPAVAYDDINCLVVWSDKRNNVDWDIFCARVDHSGMVIDPTGIAVCTEGSDQQYPAVGFDGNNYLVAWQDSRSGNFDIYGTRIGQSGVVLDTNSLLISTATGDQRNPAIAFDGTNYLIVWQDGRLTNNQDIYGTRVDQLGNVLDPEGIRICAGPSAQYYPSVAFDGTNFLVVWTDGDVYGARVSQSGVVLDSAGIAISITVEAFETSVAFDGTNYLVVWDDERNGQWEDIYGARVSQAGSVLDPSGIAISVAANQQVQTSAAFDGTNFLVVWADSRGGNFDIYGTRISQSGVVLDPNGIGISTISDWQGSPSVTFEGENYFIAFSDRFIDSDISGTRVTQSGAVLDPNGFAVSGGTNAQYYPANAYDGTNYLVVWQDSRGGNWDIYGARVDSAGLILDPGPIPISTAPNDQSCPFTSFDGTNYLVVWADRRGGSDYNIYGARLNQEGQVLDPIGFPISTAVSDQCAPSVAYDGTNYLVVWHDSRTYTSNDIYGARVNQQGIVLDPAGIPISTLSGDQNFPKVAFDGTNYLVVWSYVGDVYGTLVEQTGNVLYPNGIEISIVAEWAQYPSVAFDGANYMIVWLEHGFGDYDIYGARLSQEGLVLDPWPIAINTSINKQEYPVITFNGTDYLVVWQDLRSDSSTDIYGAALNTSGSVIDSLMITSQVGNQIRPALAHGPAEQILVTYSGWTDSINGQSVNTMRVWGKFEPFIGIAEATRTRTIQPERTLTLYPNPAVCLCHITYNIHKHSHVNISVFDTSGRLVKRLIDTEQESRNYQITTDLSALSQGVYFIRLTTDDYALTEKIILNR